MYLNILQHSSISMIISVTISFGILLFSPTTMALGSAPFTSSTPMPNPMNDELLVSQLVSQSELDSRLEAAINSYKTRQKLELLPSPLPFLTIALPIDSKNDEKVPQSVSVGKTVGNKDRGNSVNLINRTAKPEAASDFLSRGKQAAVATLKTLFTRKSSDNSENIGSGNNSNNSNVANNMSYNEKGESTSYLISDDNLDKIERYLLLAIAFTGTVLLSVLLTLILRFLFKSNIKSIKSKNGKTSLQNSNATNAIKEPIFHLSKPNHSLNAQLSSDPYLNSCIPNSSESARMTAFFGIPENPISNDSHSNHTIAGTNLETDLFDKIKLDLNNILTGVDPLKDQSEISLKLNLAQNYLEIEDKESAIALLKEVLQQGSVIEKEQAAQILEKL
jgi:FimV-like protein